jgi:hypothetical protein
MELDIFKYKDIPLYVVDLPYGLNRVHREYFTRIPWGHYKRIRYAEKVQSLSSYSLKIKIFRDYTVSDVPRSDEQIEILPAGIVDTVSNLIMYVSDSGIIPDENGNINIPGFNARINLYRSLAQTNVEYQMYTVICLVFKAYTFEMLDKLPFDRISSLFASAEKYLLENGVIKAALQIYDPRTTEDPALNAKKPKQAKQPQEPKTQDEHDSNFVLKHFIKLKEEKEKELLKEASKPAKPVSIVPDEDTKPPKRAVAPPSNPSAVEYIPPKDAYALSNGINVAVPGIKIDRNNNLGGFSENDFKGPFLSEEEVLNLQIEMGLWPAGHEFWLRQQQAEKEKEQEEEKKNTNIRIKKGIKRK